MAITFDKGKTPDPEVWTPASLGIGEEEIEVKLRRPKLDDLLADYDQPRDRASTRRVQAALCDWRGISDESGKPIPFSWKSLASLCDAFPQLFYNIAHLVDGLYFGMTETEVKNYARRLSGTFPDAEPSQTDSQTTPETPKDSSVPSESTESGSGSSGSES